jgi:putative methionine-R-sulfoxide reductase with GAF domain
MKCQFTNGWSASLNAGVSRQPNVMGTPDLNRQIDTLRSLGTAKGNRAAKAQRAIDLIRSFGPYRWAGLYDVFPSEIAVIVWSGPQAPTHPRFPIAKGLNGACVSSRKPVMVQDVASDPRYLTTIGGTRGEMIQPVFGQSGVVVGTIDVESDRVNAFSSRDEEMLTVCAKNLSWLWRAERSGG